MPEYDLNALQRTLGYCFNDAQLLRQALTHKSFTADHNERLEFLGDAVLELMVSQTLFTRFADAPEGDLTKMRSNLVRGSHLANLALDFGVDKVMRLSAGERKSGGLRRESILADALEAIIGAAYVDGGYKAAEKVVDMLFAQTDWTAVAQTEQRDAKTQLQEWLQARKLDVPKYAVIGKEGPDHAQHFVVQCCVESLEHMTEGAGGSKRQAEQVAAAAMLNVLRSSNPESMTNQNTAPVKVTKATRTTNNKPLHQRPNQAKRNARKRTAKPKS